MCASFRATAWICACQATDRDLERVSVVKINAWLCAPLTTDRDLESSSTMKRVNACTYPLLTTDHDPASATPDRRRILVTTVIFYGPFFFLSQRVPLLSFWTNYLQKLFSN